MNRSLAVLVIHPSDNVAVALEPLSIGQTIELDGRTITVCDEIPFGHKVAIEPIAASEPAIKYGQPIGIASATIAPGMHVHVENLKSRLAGLEDYRYEPQIEPAPAREDDLKFNGFIRPGGEVGIRNELWILPTVGCVNEIAESLARRFRERSNLGTVDGVFAFTHPYGCSQLGDDHANTQKILAGLARHPNAGGVLIVGLGCENNQVDSLRACIGDGDPDRYRFMIAQEAGDEHATGLALLGELAEYAGRFSRQPAPISRLRIGLKCGGSDGLSGITANLLIGRLCDELVARGASAALTEVPEMFGAEPLFMNRCRDRHVFDECVKLVNDFKQYFLRHGHAVYDNPSPGNISGGITTLEEKSLGCLQKGGTTPVVDVLPYGGRISQPGLSFIAGPGNDIVSTTLLAAAGAHAILFSSGRGTPLGSPVPTIKISSNTPLAVKKPNWIDFDAGRMLAGQPVDNVARELMELLLQTACGAPTRNEQNGFREIAIFKDGVTL
jgi:altronate hydrolase